MRFPDCFFLAVLLFVCCLTSWPGPEPSPSSVEESADCSLTTDASILKLTGFCLLLPSHDTNVLGSLWAQHVVITMIMTMKMMMIISLSLSSVNTSHVDVPSND
jgi:hypothetical protein